MAEPAAAERWTPWIVAPGSGFEVRGTDGEVGLVQITADEFLVTNRFRFDDQPILERFVARLVRRGMTSAEARAAVDDARTFKPSVENPTDLASIPRFMRWFESPYGRHTLAAILHDELIAGAPNSGALGSDTQSDRFFRKMLWAAGTPWLKRWIMWSAVALRSRWVADGRRKLYVGIWGVLALVGIALFFWGLFDLARSGCRRGRRKVAVAIALPFVAGLLWGRQYIASVIAAVAALFIVPAVVFVFLGTCLYEVLELLVRPFSSVARRFSRTGGARS